MDRFNPFDPRYQLEAEDYGELACTPLSRNEIRHTILMLDRLALCLKSRWAMDSGAGKPGRGPGIESRSPD